MKKIAVGYYIDPKVWFGKKEEPEKAQSLAFTQDDFSPLIDIGIQNQGFVLALFKVSQIENYQERSFSNVLKAEVASFALNFFNAFSFALYEAQAKKFNGAFQTSPQEVLLEDLYLWSEEGYNSIEETNQNYPSPLVTGRFYGFNEMVARSSIYSSSLNDKDLTMRPTVDKDIFTNYFDKKLISSELTKLFALINRGIVSTRNASFDISIVNFWSVIEFTVSEIWNGFLEKNNINKKRREALHIKELKASVVIESLNLHKLIDDTLYDQITKIRKARNNLYHNLDIPKPEVCYIAFEVVKQLIKINYDIKLFHNGTLFMGSIKHP